MSTGNEEQQMNMDKFTSKAGDFRMSQCASCFHKHIGKPTCDAFPEGIPQPLLSGDVKHDDPYPGDGGFRYHHYKSPPQQQPEGQKAVKASETYGLPVHPGCRCFSGPVTE